MAKVNIKRGSGYKNGEYVNRKRKVIYNIIVSFDGDNNDVHILMVDPENVTDKEKSKPFPKFNFIHKIIGILRKIFGNIMGTIIHYMFYGC